MIIKQNILNTVIIATLLTSTTAFAQEQNTTKRNAYFGDTHIHTAMSLDAYIGGTRLMPSDSLRFAKGEAVIVNGRHKQLDRPLDFVAISDHVEYLGEMYSTIYPDAPGHLNEELVSLRMLDSLKEKQSWFYKYVVSNNRGANPSHPPFYQGKETTKSGWQVIVDAAQKHNNPGKFTAFIAFEWSAAPNGGNMHRNVIFRDDVIPELPITSFDSNKVEDLWEWLQDTADDGSTVLAIPHNSNASKGQMFPKLDSFGDPVDSDYAEARAKWEPLIEMMQVKGNSEVHRNFWSADEFSNFENADTIQKNSNRWYSKRDFVREGLKIGLGYEQKLGTNPFKLGFIGGTDTHNGLAADVAENDFIGSHAGEDGSVQRRRKAGVGGWIDGPDISLGSVAGVWAEENTRGSIYDAMKRRETFATSGPRIKIRMFAGTKLSSPSDEVAMVSEGYAKGTPMGGTLPTNTKAPTFTVLAQMDSMAANLDRIQIIKGWVDIEGELHEKIVEVSWAGKRALNKKGKLPPIGNTVDLKKARYTNDIGEPTLMGTWTDTDFDSTQHAFYYARALEIPTPRWTTYEAVRNGLPLLPDVAAIIQERAWGSPIWYSPEVKN